jgi:hypothetical protein
VTASALDPLGYVLHSVQRVVGPGTEAEDSAVAVVTRFLSGGEPGWLRHRPEHVRLDVLTVCELLGRRRAR